MGAIQVADSMRVGWLRGRPRIRMIMLLLLLVLGESAVIVRRDFHCSC